MATTELFCRYVGRFATDQSNEQCFDDRAVVSDVRSTLSDVALIYIDDPMSFPWEDLGPLLTPLVVLDMGRCSSSDVVALRPMFGVLTAADTIVDTANGHANALAAEFSTRTVAPSNEAIEELLDLKQLELAEQKIRRLIADDLGDGAIVERVEVSTLAHDGLTFAGYLATTAKTLSASPVGVWGVRREPGAPLAYGLVVFEPRDKVAPS